MTPRDAAMELMEHAYRADVTSPAGLRGHLDLVTGWAPRLDVWRLEYPRVLAGAPAVAAAVSDHAASGFTPDAI